MTTTTIDVFGTRVRQARVLRRMTGRAVMDHMGWKGARQTRLEQAESTGMNPEELTRLAQILRFPEHFFTTAPSSRVDPASLLFRAPKSTTVAEKDFLAEFAATAGEFLDNLNTQSQLPPVKLPVLPRGTSPVLAAGQVRDRLGAARDLPIAYLMYEVERCGVAIIARVRRSRSDSAVDWSAGNDDGPLEKHLGYSTRIGEFSDRPLIVLRATDSWERTRWTLAHEVGHLVLHADGVNTEDQELEASRFASELLAPADAIADEVPGVPSLLNLVPLKMKWGISLGALIRHLFESKLIDSSRYDMLRRQLYTRVNAQTGHTWGKTEPGWDEREVERPRMLAKWVERCYSATSATMLGPHGLIWPPDVLDDLLAGQRSAPGRVAVRSATTTPSGGGNVVDFDRFRQRRHA